MVRIQTMLPTTLLDRFKKLPEAESLFAILWRVVGGTMSLSAARRSAKVSFSGTSESTESTDTEEDAEDDVGEE